MSRSFDKILSRRIREVFDNHREPVDPEAWRDMESRLNARRNMRVVYVGRIAGVAAVLLLLFLLVQPFKQSEQSIEQPSPVVSSRQAESPVQPAGDEAGRQEKAAVREKMAEKVTQKETSAREETSAVLSELSGEPTQRIQPEKVSSIASDDVEDRISGNRLAGLDKLEARYAGIEILNDKSTQVAEAMAEPFDPFRETIAQRNESPDFWADLPPGEAPAEKEEQVNFGVEVSTLYNYSSSMLESEVNFAGGFISEIELLPRLSLNTGVVLSRQHFTTSKTDREFYRYLSKNNSLSAVPSFDGSYSRYDLVNTSISDVYNRVRLVGVDIPVNLEYRYNRLSVSAGVSSLTYIQEEYRHGFTSSYLANAYDEANNVVDSREVSETELLKETFSPFSKLDLANILNVSVGYHIPLGHSSLVVEPFMKHPLGDLANRDIRFGSRGIRVKVRF